MKSKKRVLSLVLLLSMFVSGLGLSNISKAEDEIAPEQETTVVSEQISEDEGKEIFEDDISKNEEVAPLEEEGLESIEETESEDVEISEEITNEDNKKENPVVTDNGVEEVIEASEDGEKAKAEEAEKSSTKKKPWEIIKDGDFFVDIQEAIKDEAGNILGWVEGIINGDNGDYDDDYNWKADLDIGNRYEPIKGETDGSGSWKATIKPDADGTTYYKVTESTKYQDRDDNGELLYEQADGEPGTEKTDKPILKDGPLPGVKYDKTIYYLKYEGSDLVEVRVVYKGDTDPFAGLDNYSKEEIKKHTDITIDEDEERDPIDFFIEYLQNKGAVAVDDTEGLFNGLKNYIEEGESIDKPLSFNNTFEPPEVDGKIEGEKELVGRPLEDGEFEFILTDKDGEPILDKDGNPVKGTNKDGKFEIELPVDDEGEFEYYLSEKDGGNSTIEYDGKVYTVVIRVKYDRLTNTLKTEIFYKDEDGNILDPSDVKFINSYTPPTKPPTEPTEPTEPPTTPTEPTEPTAPTTPTEPTEPTVPTTPTEPTKPVKPTTPTKPGKELPKTGMVGTLGLGIAGIGLVAGGLYTVKSKKDDEQ